MPDFSSPSLKVLTLSAVAAIAAIGMYGMTPVVSHRTYSAGHAHLNNSDQGVMLDDQDLEHASLPSASAGVAADDIKSKESSKGSQRFRETPISTLSYVSHPVAILMYNVLATVPFRFCIRGAGYTTTRAWYAFAFVVHALVLSGLSIGAFRLPLHADWPTLLHLVFAFVYLQTDLLVSRLLVGPAIGPWTIPALIRCKFSIWSDEDHMDEPGATEASLKWVPPLITTLFELVGATLHEIWWCVFLSQSAINWGWHPIAAILLVPIASSIAHGICSNVNVGIRFTPTFLSVALSYHASGSIAVPAVIHIAWYLCDAKFLSLLTNFKRAWDLAERKEETGTPSWDRACTLSTVVCLLFYVPLNIATTFYPTLMSQDGLHRAAHAHPWRDVRFLWEQPDLWAQPEVFVVICGCTYFVVGILAIPHIMPWIDRVGNTGELFVEKDSEHAARSALLLEQDSGKN